MSSLDTNHNESHVTTFTFHSEDLMDKHNPSNESTDSQMIPTYAEQDMDNKSISGLSVDNDSNQVTDDGDNNLEGSTQVVKSFSIENKVSEASDITTITTPSIKRGNSISEKNHLPIDVSDNIRENGGINSSLSQTESNKLYPNSPTGSTSSLSSTESTREIIKNLSVKNLTYEENQQSVSSEHSPSVLETSTSLPKNDKASGRSIQSIEQNEFKKPIKFTVRKVSREEFSLKDNKRENIKPVSHRYGNLPENRAKVVEHKSGDKDHQIKQNQAKYDEYATRIEKIDKEIQFLTTLLPPYNVEIDYATRSKITRAIEKLGCKKDEIEKKKYELGMSISRLWREFDDNNTWVRSVSNH